jgi:PBS lyase HEAT-like repeat
MSNKNTPQNTRQRIAFFVVMFLGFLATGVFAGISVFAAHQKNQDFSQLDAEEKFLRLPEYLQKDRLLLKNKDAVVQISAARALADLRSKEAIPELIVLLKDSINYESGSLLYTVDCAVAKALAKLEAREAVPQIISSLEKSEQFIFDPDSCIAIALQVLQGKKTVSQLKEEVDIFSITLFENPSKELVSRLISRLDKIDGIEYYAILQKLVSWNILDQSQIRKAILKAINKLEGSDALSDSNEKSFAIKILAEIYLKYNQKLKGSTVKELSIQSRQIRDSQWILTGFTLAAFFFLLVLTLFALRELQRILWKDHLTCYFPEEVVGELIVLRQELTQAKKYRIIIETTLLYVVFTLIWAFYIQINLDNLWLPSKDQRRR